MYKSPPTEAQKVGQIAKEFRDNSYEVKIEPSPDELPFSLGSYRPDLIAFKDDGGIILEVKGRQARFLVDRYQKVAAS